MIRRKSAGDTITPSIDSTVAIIYSRSLSTWSLNYRQCIGVAKTVMKVTGLNGKASSAKVHFYAINDFGGAIEGNASL
jgi:P pilus assembly chaperone PapD